MEVIRKRILFGTKYRSIHNIEGLPNLGFLNVMFEQIAGEMFLVNEKDFFVRRVKYLLQVTIMRQMLSFQKVS